MKKYKILGYLFLVLVFTIFIPATNYQVFAKTTTKTTIHKATTLKNVKKSKVKKTTLPGAPTGVSGFAHVAVCCLAPGAGMLTRFPFDGRRALRP